MKIALNDFTFLIPVRIDSVIRLENTLSVVDYLCRNFVTNIIILEASYYQNTILKRLLPKKVEYYFVEDKDPVFYRTYYLNHMTSKVKTDFLAIWDTDAIAPLEQILDVVSQLRNNKADVAFPYEGVFLDVSEIIRSLFITSKKLSILTRNINKMKPLYPTQKLKGGGLFVNVKKYIEAGGENEHFYGWGSEDFERYNRWEGLGYRIYRSKGYLFHLSHPRDMNGRHSSRQQMFLTNNEVLIAKNSSRKEILERINQNSELTE